MSEERELMKIIEEITENQREASKDPMSYPHNIRPGKQVLQQQCKLRLEALLKEFESAIIPNRLVGLFVDGKKEDIDRLTNFVRTRGSIVVDGGMMYTRLAQDVEPSYSANRRFDVTQYSLMLDGLTSLGMDLGYNAVEQPAFKEAQCKDFAATVEHIKNVCRPYLGDEINLRLIKKHILDTVQNDKLRAEQLLVVVYGANQEEKSRIQNFFSRSTTLTLQENYQPDAGELREILKPNKKTEKTKSEKSKE